MSVEEWQIVVVSHPMNLVVAMALVPVIVLIIGTPAFANGVVAVFGPHAFFAMLFVGSALLFRCASANRL